MPAETMHTDAQISFVLPDWLKLRIADAVTIFSRLECTAIEIAWLLKDDDLNAKIKTARGPASENFKFIMQTMEKASGRSFNAMTVTFSALAQDRNLITHGVWMIVDKKRPYVVWHKFLEDDDSVIGEFYLTARFDDFMVKAEHLLNTLVRTKNLLEEQVGKTVGPRIQRG